MFTVTVVTLLALLLRAVSDHWFLGTKSATTGLDNYLIFFHVQSNLPYPDSPLTDTSSYLAAIKMILYYTRFQVGCPKMRREFTHARTLGGNFE